MLDRLTILKHITFYRKFSFSYMLPKSKDIKAEILCEDHMSTEYLLHNLLCQSICLLCYIWTLLLSVALKNRCLEFFLNNEHILFH